MTLGLIAVGGGVGGLIALAMLLTFGLGPVAALLVFWIGGLAATLFLAASIARSTVSIPEEHMSPSSRKGDGI